ncbi:MAG: DUF4147 domain-containing protein [Gammaproteobacteria bacterium]|nr:DUF4147 domain-containing protein [Gammaproteobacteria bacterium]
MSFARKHLLQIYQAALAAVQGELCTQRALTGYDSGGPVAVVAIGKAASSMMQGAITALGDTFDKGLLITKEGHCDRQLQNIKNIQCLESAHPVPDQRSLCAGQTLLEFMAARPVQSDFIFLISGGTSSLVEVLPDGVSLEDLQRVNNWLLGSGWNIAAMNRVRKSLSCIKGGRLAQKLAGCHTNCLMISDVPDNSPQVIASGFLSPDIVDEPQPENIPEWIKKLPRAPSAPLLGNTCFNTVTVDVIAKLEDAMQAAKKRATVLGYDVHLHQDLITCDAEFAGQQLARKLRDDKPGLHIWGGETTVCLPDSPGRGGRNQQLALAAAAELAGTTNNYFLAAGTDGSDGPTQAAGALVDGYTLQRGLQAGFDVQQTLASANAGDFLQASGDLIITGPTGTNVMDLVLAIKCPTA